MKLKPNGWMALGINMSAKHSEWLDRFYRIRQDRKPLLNKLETEWRNYLIAWYPHAKIHAQERRYKLANGVWYKPDFTATVRTENDEELKETAWEVKGPHAFRGGYENLKVAAGLWPEVRWILVWKEGANWLQQEILL